MSQKILILYASSKGSTKEIAEHIATQLSTHQPPLGTITCLPITSSPSNEDIPAFDAIIIGSAIHGGAWITQATKYLSSNIVTLTTPATKSTPITTKTASTLTPHKGLWAFSVGAPSSLPKFMQTKELLNEAETIKGELEGRYGLKLRDHGFFNGVAKKEAVPWVFRGCFQWIGGQFGDFREWEKIDGWSDGVVGALRK